MNANMIARGFRALARQGRSAYAEVVEGAAYLAPDAACDDLYVDDEDGRVPYNPSIKVEDVYWVYDDQWTPRLRRADRQFDLLCKEYLSAAVAAGSRDPEGDLEDAIKENFWDVIGMIDGDELSNAYDDVRSQCRDTAERSRDPYRFHGVSRRDFLASRVMTASDRVALTRIASKLPKGDSVRRAILAGLVQAK